MALDPSKFIFKLQEPDSWGQRVRVEHPDFRQNMIYTIDAHQAICFSEETGEVILAVRDWLRERQEESAA